MKSFLTGNKAILTPAHIANPLFDEAFYRNQYFLFGENHGSSQPQQYDLALLKHLHERAGVRYYLAEVDFTKAWMLNNYLKDGNPAWLDKVFASWKNDTAQWANKEYYNKFIELRRYQQPLPAGKKITVIGIDIPQDYTLIREQLAYLTKGKKFDQYQPLFDSLYTLAGDAGKNELVAFSKRFFPVMAAGEAFFSRKLGPQYPAFRHLITSLTFIGSGMSRDSAMYRNLQSQLAIFHLETEKMYGFIGFYHCLQTGYNNLMPFAALLKKHRQPEGMVSLQMFALDSKAMVPFVAQIRQMMPKTYTDKLLQEDTSFPKDGRYIPYELSNDNFMMKIDGIEILKELSAPGSVSLFKLTGTASPFNSTNKLSQVTGFQTIALTNKADHTIQAFQFILLFRGSSAATPL